MHAHRFRNIYQTKHCEKHCHNDNTTAYAEKSGKHTSNRTGSGQYCR
jgi:hypothetical protein